MADVGSGGRAAFQKARGMGEGLVCPLGQGPVSQMIQAGFLNFGTADVWGSLCFGGGRGGPLSCVL